MAIHWGGRGVGHTSRWSKAATAAADLYQVGGTRFRQSTATLTVSATYVHQVIDVEFGTEPWVTTEHAFFFPTFYNTLGGGTHETATTSKGVFKECLFLISGTWQAATIVGGPITIDPATDTVGKWIEVTTSYEVPANTLQRMRWVIEMDASATAPGSSTYYGNEKGQGYTTAGAASTAASSGTALNNTNSTKWFPCARMSKGGDRDSVVIIGDSIGFGVDMASVAGACTARNEFGFISIGLDDNSTTQRIPYLNLCIAGQSPENYADNTKVGKKLAIMEQAVTLNGGQPVCQVLMSNHIHNATTATLSPLLTVFRNMYSLWKTALGNASMHVCQIECTPSTSTSDNWATDTNQTPTAAVDYSTGIQWQFNEAVGGTDGLGDANATLRADGSIQSSIGIWRYCAGDTSTKRDKGAVQAFNTTLAADWSSGNPSLNASPAVGSVLSFGAKQEAAYVTAVSGSGPYTATVTIMSGAISPTITAGGNVRAVLAFDGVHPSAYAHKSVMHQGLIDWKTAQGYV